MPKLSAALATIMGLLVSSIAVAHPGHGYISGDFSLVHYLIEPVHMVTGLSLVMGLLLAASYGVRAIGSRRRASR